MILHDIHAWPSQNIYLSRWHNYHHRLISNSRFLSCHHVSQPNHHLYKSPHQDDHDWHIRYHILNIFQVYKYSINSIKISCLWDKHKQDNYTKNQKYLVYKLSNTVTCQPVSDKKHALWLMDQQNLIRNDFVQ